jgi:hypothetical protein
VDAGDNSVLSQSKGGYACFAGVESSNPAYGLSIRSLNGQLDTTASWKPEFKKAISQGTDGFIDKDISILISGFNIKFHLGQFPLTGGHKMSRSFMGPVYVRGNSDQHLLFWKRNLYNFIFGQFKYNLSGVHVTFNFLFGPFPFIGNRHSLNGIHIFQDSFR